LVFVDTGFETGAKDSNKNEVQAISIFR
jgi:hypothetical protein